ncbi:MAG TPA: hypothetical protein VF171_08330 [Trueperaceae bacterium]
MSIAREALFHAAVSSLVADRLQTRFLCGDWRELKTFAPFSLLFVDAGDAENEGAPDVLELLGVGGVAALDDFSYGPEGRWQGTSDARREF